MAGRIRRVWEALKRPPVRLSLGAVLIIGAASAGALWGSFVVVMDKTSSTEFCVACHEMDPVFAEWQQSVHFHNSSGVQAQCKDCHIPRSWHGKIGRKINATFVEVPSKIMGKISTPEKFEARRREFAEKIWAEMKHNDSRECRECHDPARMNSEEQSPMARRKHAEAASRGKTCIECHQGVAHNLPKEPDEPAAEPAAETAGETSPSPAPAT